MKTEKVVKIEVIDESVTEYFQLDLESGDKIDDKDVGDYQLKDVIRGKKI